MITTKLLSSLEKVFLDEEPQAAPWTQMSALRGERVNFQWAIYLDKGERREATVTVESPLKEYICLYEVGHVPSLMPVNEFSDTHHLRRTPGLYPDALFPRPDGHVTLLSGQWRTVWVEVELPAALSPGSYSIRLQLNAGGSEDLSQAEFKLQVLEPILPAQTLMHTEWFHCDCLAVHYHVSIFSEEHWSLMKHYMETAVRYGINMLLTPIFTPPLDTEIGGERPTVQLVDVTVEDDGYRFGFVRLKRFLDMAREAGMQYFEMAHLFTQWGAAHAPKIMAYKNGHEERIFGWDTDSGSAEYIGFLNQFLPELKKFLKAEGILERCWFHISDEPSPAALESYRVAKASVQDVLADCHTMDALSSIEFYRQGLVACPVPANDHIEAFIDEGIQGLWTYYCCGQTAEVSNRMMAMPSARNRILGWQMYKFNINGFLHWGYNFWFSAFSKRAIDPYAVTDADEHFPSGDPFVVYPGENGEPIPSIRLMVFHEALQDMRALQLLESKCSRERTLAWLNDRFSEEFNFKIYPREAQTLLDSREQLNAIITQGIQ